MMVHQSHVSMHVLAMFQLFQHLYLGTAAATDMHCKHHAKVYVTGFRITSHCCKFGKMICHIIQQYASQRQ